MRLEQQTFLTVFVAHPATVDVASGLCFANVSRPIPLALDWFDLLVPRKFRPGGHTFFDGLRQCKICNLALDQQVVIAAIVSGWFTHPQSHDPFGLQLSAYLLPDFFDVVGR